MLQFFLIHPFMKFWKLSLLMTFMSFMMMKFSLNMNLFNISFFIGLDILSFFLIMLSIIIFSLSILPNNNLNNKKFYFFFILLLLKILILLFMLTNFFFFYMFFEFSLIPMLMIIIGWGLKVERLQASIYFMFYTMFSSLPFFYFMISYMLFINSNYMFMVNNMTNNYKDFFFFFFLVFMFLVKMPIFLFHLWLPKAHVEAPVSGSMILAGILLKLGGYGMIRIMMILMEYMNIYSSFFISFSLWGGLMISFSCLNQLDMKMIVAFSSIAHMSLLISGLFSMNILGIYGSFLIMMAHGLSSSNLFMLINVIYNRSFSRSLILNKGLINIYPNLTLCSFLVISSSMASPPSINLLSEFILFYSIMNFFNGFMLIMFFFLLMSICYSMYMYSFSHHGKMYSGLYFFNKIFLIEYLIMIIHWILNNIFIMKSEFLTILI